MSELLRKAKQRSMQQIERTPVPNMQGAGLKLVLDYLLHHGYPDTAAAVRPSRRVFELVLRRCLRQRLTSAFVSYCPVYMQYVQGHDPNPKGGEPCQPSPALSSIDAQGDIQNLNIKSQRLSYHPRRPYFVIPIRSFW